MVGELRNFYSGTFFASDSFNDDPIFIATAVREQIQTFGKDISFSVIVKSGGLFYVDGYIYAEKNTVRFIYIMLQGKCIMYR